MKRSLYPAQAVVLLVLAAGTHTSSPMADGPGALQNNPFKRPVFDTTPRSDPDADGFASDSELDVRAILVAGRDSLVNVAGTIIRVGQEHEGYRLVSVEERAVVFDKEGERLKVELDQEDESDEED